MAAADSALVLSGRVDGVERSQGGPGGRSQWGAGGHPGAAASSWEGAMPDPAVVPSSSARGVADAAVALPGSGPAPSQPSTVAPAPSQLLCVSAARDILIAEATRSGNDIILKHLLAEKRTEAREDREAARPETVHLRLAQKQSLEQAAKRRLERQEESRRAANEDEERKRATARAQLELQEAKRACLEQALRNREDAERRRVAAARAKAIQRWLQTEYPAQLAARMIAFYRGMRGDVRENYKKMVDDMISARWFSRLPANIPLLWNTDDSFNFPWCRMTPPHGGPLHGVRCSAQFNTVLGTYYQETFAAKRNAEGAMLEVFKQCIPKPSQIFAPPVSFKHLLVMNDYSMDMTFVHGAIMLSKWLGQDRYPCGVFGLWPPEPPPGAIPAIEPEAVAPGDDDAAHRDP